MKYKVHKVSDKKSNTWLGCCHRQYFCKKHKYAFVAISRKSSSTSSKVDELLIVVSSGN